MGRPHTSDVFTAATGEAYGASAGTYPLALYANGKRLRIRRARVSAASAGSAAIYRCTANAGGVEITDVNLNGEASGTAIAYPSKGTRSADHTPTTCVLIDQQAMAAGNPALFEWDNLEFRLAADQYLLVFVKTTSNDDLVYADVDWEELG
jgi:hypothetical protein